MVRTKGWERDKGSVSEFDIMGYVNYIETDRNFSYKKELRR